MERVLEIGCTAMWTYLTLPICIHKGDQGGKFYDRYIVPHFKTKYEKENNILSHTVRSVTESKEKEQRKGGSGVLGRIQRQYQSNQEVEGEIWARTGRSCLCLGCCYNQYLNRPGPTGGVWQCRGKIKWCICKVYTGGQLMQKLQPWAF